MWSQLEIGIDTSDSTDVSRNITVPGLLVNQASASCPEAWDEGL